jgi:hypothetical protein
MPCPGSPCCEPPNPSYVVVSGCPFGSLGNLLPGATVTILSPPPGSAVLAMGITGADGRFSFSLPVGTLFRVTITNVAPFLNVTDPTTYNFRGGVLVQGYPLALSPDLGGLFYAVPPNYTCCPISLYSYPIKQNLVYQDANGAHPLNYSSVLPAPPGPTNVTGWSCCYNAPGVTVFKSFVGGVCLTTDGETVVTINFCVDDMGVIIGTSQSYGLAVSTIPVLSAKYYLPTGYAYLNDGMPCIYQCGGISFPCFPFTNYPLGPPFNGGCNDGIYAGNAGASSFSVVSFNPFFAMGTWGVGFPAGPPVTGNFTIFEA